MLTTIEKVNIDPNLPLLICDADEVIFQFMESFEHYLTSNSLFFSYKSFKLNGNIINLKLTSRKKTFFEMLVDVKVKNLNHFTNIIASIRSLDSVSSVNRIKGK